MTIAALRPNNCNFVIAAEGGALVWAGVSQAQQAAQDSAESAVESAISASVAESAANSAASEAAVMAGNTQPFLTYAAGLAATSDDYYFSVLDAEDMVEWVYKRVSGAGVLQTVKGRDAARIDTVSALVGSPAVVGNLPNMPLVDFDAVDAASGAFRFRNRAKGPTEGHSALAYGFANGVYAPPLSEYWSATVAAGVEDVDGGQTAFNVKGPAVSTGNVPHVITTLNALPPGQYTIAFTVRAASGAQSFAYAHREVGSAFVWTDIAEITTTPTVITKTIEITDKKNMHILWAANKSAAPTDAMDVIIEGLRVVPGASAGAPDKINMDVVSRSSNRPLVKDLVLDVAGNNLRNTLAVQRDAVAPLNEMTFLACLNWDGDIDRAASLLLAAGGGSDPTTQSAFHFGMGNNRDTMLVVVGGSTGQKPMANPFGAGWCVVGIRVTPNEKTVFMNGRIAGVNGIGGGSNNIQLLGFLGGGTTFPVTGKVSGFTLYDRALTDAEIAAATSVLKNRVMLKGYPVFENDNFYISEGDSITASYNYSYNLQMGRNFSPRLLGRNFAVSGSTFATMDSRKPAVIEAINQLQSEGKHVIFSAFIGANHTFTSDVGADAFYANLVAYWADIRATGAKVIACTLIPKSGLATMEYINRINDNIRGDASKYDGLADFQASPAFEVYDADYFLDGLHPNAAGHAIMADIMLPVLQGVSTHA